MNAINHAFGVLKVFALCRLLGGSFAENLETMAIGFFDRDELPAALAEKKTTRAQILMCFDFIEQGREAALFD